MAGILCHSNCRKDKTDLILENWVWAKLRAAGFELVGETQLLSAEVAIAAATKVVQVAAALTKPRKTSSRPPPLGKAKVQSPDSTLNVRSGPKNSARKLRMLKNGKVVKVFGLNSGWACISASGKSWVARRYLEPIEALTPTEQSISLPAPSVDHKVSQADTLYEVFYSDTAKKQLRRDVPLYQLTDRVGLFHKGSMQVDVDGSPRAY